MLRFKERKRLTEYVGIFCFSVISWQYSLKYIDDISREVSLLRFHIEMVFLALRSIISSETFFSTVPIVSQRWSRLIEPKPGCRGVTNCFSSRDSRDLLWPVGSRRIIIRGIVFEWRAYKRRCTSHLSVCWLESWKALYTLRTTGEPYLRSRSHRQVFPPWRKIYAEDTPEILLPRASLIHRKFLYAADLHRCFGQLTLLASSNISARRRIEEKMDRRQYMV